MRALAHELEGSFGHPDGAHAMVDAPRAETRLADEESSAFLPKEVLGRDADILERDLAMSMARVVSEHRQRAFDRDSGGVHRDENQAVLEVLVRLGIAQPEEETDLATRVRGAGRPPLASIDNVVVTVAGDRAGEVRWVRAGHSRL